MHVCVLKIWVAEDIKIFTLCINWFNCHVFYTERDIAAAVQSNGRPDARPVVSSKGIFFIDRPNKN